MPKSKKKSVLTGGLFADTSGEASPSPLTLVDSTIVIPFERPKKLGAQPSPNHKTGRLGAQTAERDAKLGAQNESSSPCRQKYGRLHLRPNRDLLKKVKDECKTEDPNIDISRATDDAWRLWLTARGLLKLGVQAPTGISSSGFDLSVFEELIKTTTTKTLGAQKLKSPTLPGFAAKILQLVPEVSVEHPPESDRPYLSRHPYGINWAYAIDENQNERGLKNPFQWVEGPKGNIYSGKFDRLIDIWLGRMQREEDEAHRRAAKQTRQEEELHQRATTLRAEQEHRKESGDRQPWKKDS